ncbi:TPA: hypothetical protein TYI17_002266 [Streptococcus suis]|uniref:hypothetical protein n=1 Tax=Streptococcus suis TaxID=1307 RepID=UPI000943907F|nr:hypothetical protein [Streptococcus suis]HEL1931443.1 hypothetical protein [Streptococcus suis]HEL1932924.1 hypothetical protein [Streptococcus suis]HEL2449501.1 hypothetical protein [Streptococcus suis]
MNKRIKKLFWEIFPENKKGWEKYFDWCLYDSKTFYPVGKLLNIYATIMLFLTELLIYSLVILLFPLTRIELRIHANKVRKQRKKNND